MTSPLIELIGIAHDYPNPAGAGRRRVLDGIDLRLGPGERLGIMGPSGAGKSTLARILIGLEPPSQGRLCFAGHELDPRRRPDRARLREAVQMVWQDPALYLNPRLSVEQQIEEALALRRPRLSRPDRRVATAALLAQVGLPPDLLPRRPHEISGGQAQRVAISRALARAPRLLVCDEILANLDLPAQLAILDLLAQLHAETGLALILIGHDIRPIARLCQRVIWLDQGRILTTAPESNAIRTAAKPDR
ncbi:dipeptide/oligopeptide/nickel ABC transporter ATP-binding protein [Thioalkalicoccus limnaeus]|uniref:Dipeptide/oligopeptide/nickel ABC transporter ATP-binding protein n=1 Tax=Thioalkalicoccus limnaeus TaxID=120681 RepID=A0ABV4BIJ3_9GAMM